MDKFKSPSFFFFFFFNNIVEIVILRAEPTDTKITVADSTY